MKSKYKVIPYLLSLSLYLSGCGTVSSNVNTDGEVMETIEVSNVESNSSVDDISFNMEEVTKEDTSIENEEENDVIVDKNERFIDNTVSTDVKLDDLTSSYYDYFDSLTFNYNHQDYYPTNYVDTSSLGDCSYVFDGNVTALVDEIEKNSKELEDKDNFFIDNNKENLVKAITYIVENSNNNIDEDMHLISELKICYGDNENEATAVYDHESNTIIVNRSEVSFTSNINNISFDKGMIYVLVHELNHARQNVCSCRNNSDVHDIRYGRYEMFMLESSAESSLYNQELYTSNPDYIYLNERNYEAELLLLGMIGNKNIDSYYNAIFDTDINSLYNFYSLKDNEIDDYYNIIYNMDALCYRNELPFSLSTDGDDVEVYQNSIKEVGFEYKVNLFDLLIKRLLIKNSTENLSLEENLVIYDYIKGILMFNDTAIKFSDDVINDFNSLDEVYISYLSNKYNVDIDEIRKDEYVNIRVLNTCIYEMIKGMEITNPSLSSRAEEYINKYPILINVLNNTYNYSPESLINSNQDVYDEVIKKLN